MKNTKPTIYLRCWLLLINLFLMVLISSCSSSSDNSSPFSPQNTLDGKVIVLGSQVDDVSGDLIMYVTGTDLKGAALTPEQLQTASVSVDGVSYVNGEGTLNIEAVTEGEPILSLGFVSDYSNSINGETKSISDIYTTILDNLPSVFEAQVMTFSDEYEVQQTWTSDLELLKTAVANQHSSPNKTALYDTMRAALEGDEVVTGLINRCRPAHMLVVFTDGDDNMSSVGYNELNLESVVNQDKTIVIMLATSKPVSSVLETLAGEYGYVVQVNEITGLPVELANWAASLNYMATFRLDSSVNITGKTVRINLGDQTAEVDANLHCPAIY